MYPLWQLQLVTAFNTWSDRSMLMTRVASAGESVRLKGNFSPKKHHLAFPSSISKAHVAHM